MKYCAFILLYVFSVFRALPAQQVELNRDEYFSWKVNYTPYIIKAIQAINDFRSLAQDSTLPRARFQDDIIIIQSRISGKIEQVWYGSKSTSLYILPRKKVQAVFSKSFIETILNRNQYYYLNFDAFGESNALQKSRDYMYSTWWGSYPMNELLATNFRVLVFVPTANVHAETSVGDEYSGLPSWTSGFMRVGIVHTSFRIGLQMANVFQPLFGRQNTLNGALGGYGALNLENLRIGIASAFKSKNNFDNTITNKDDINYAGLITYFSYSPMVWNGEWGAGRLWLGVSVIRMHSVREDSFGNFAPQRIPLIERSSQADSVRALTKGIVSPIIRLEFVSPVQNQNYSTLELFAQFANFSATTSLVVNLGQTLGFGVLTHYNFSNRTLYPKGMYIFPILRLRF